MVVYLDVTDAFKIKVDVKDTNEVICQSSTRDAKIRVRGSAVTPSISSEQWPALASLASLSLPPCP